MKKPVLRSPFQEEYDDLILLYFFTYLYFLPKNPQFYRLCSLALILTLGKPFPCHVRGALLLWLVPQEVQAAKESSLPGGLAGQSQNLTHDSGNIFRTDTVDIAILICLGASICFPALGKNLAHVPPAGRASHMSRPLIVNSEC